MNYLEGAKKIRMAQHCNKCNKLTEWHKTMYYDEIIHQPRSKHICTQCPGFKIPNNSHKNNGTLYHFEKCYTNNAKKCYCDLYYCSVPGCTELSVGGDLSLSLLDKNHMKSKCSGHKLYCLKCKKNTFWIMEDAFPNEPWKPNFVIAPMICGPCHGYSKNK